MLRNFIRNRLQGAPQQNPPGFSSRWRKRALILLGATLAIFVLGHLGVRFILWPQIEKSKPTLERLVSARLGTNVTMDEVQVSWTGIRPSFDIKGLRFNDPTSTLNPSPLFIETIQGELSWLTFYHLAPYFHEISINKVQLFAERDQKGEISVAGIPIHTKANDLSTENWLLAQNEIQINDATIFWKDQKGRKLQTSIDISRFRFTNGIRHHQGELKAITPWSSTPINIEADFVHRLGGQAGNWQDWIGEFSWDVSGFNLDQASRDIVLPFQNLTGNINTQGKLKLDTGKIDQGEMQLAAEQLKVQLNKDEDALEFGRLETNLFKENTRGLNSITAKTLAWSDIGSPQNSPLKNLSPITFRWRSPKDGGEIKEFGLASPKIMVQDISLFALNLPLSKKIHRWIKTAQANGELQNVDINWSENQSTLSSLPLPGNWFASNKLDFTVGAKLIGISFTGINKSIPSVTNLSGTLSGDQKQGSLTLNSENMSFELNDFLSSPYIQLDKANGNISWAKQKGGWLIDAKDMELINSEIDTSFNLAYLIGGPKQADQMTLDMEFARAKLATAHRYLPISMDKESRLYLSNAFESGDINKGTLRIKGDPDQIPFAASKTDELTLHLPFSQASFKPAPLLPKKQGVWSMFTNVNGTIDMKQSSINVNVDKANYKNVVLSNVRSQIPNVSAKHLTLVMNGQANGEGSEILEYLTASPVGVGQPSIAKNLSLAGPVSLDLDLTIPLSGNAENKIDAKVTLPGNKLQWSEFPPLENLKGMVRITDTNPQFEDISADFLGGVLKISSMPSSSDKSSFKVSGDINAKFVQAYALRNPHSKINPTLMSAMSGSASYSGLMSFGKEVNQANLKFDLRNWASLAPAPANKISGTPMTGQLDLNIYSNKKPNAIHADWSANFGDQYYIQGNLGNDNSIRGAFGIGAAASLPQQGYSVNLVNNEIDFDAWMEFLDAGKPNIKASTEVDLSQPDRHVQISAQIKKLIAFDREWNDFNFGASEKNNVWQLRLNTPQLSGQMQWQPASPEHPSGLISGRLPRLKIPDQRTTTDKGAGKFNPKNTSLSPNKVPSLDITIDDVSWTKAQLGSVKIKSRTSQDVLMLNSLQVNNPQGNSVITGQWSGKTSSNPEQSNINLDVNIRDAGQIISRWSNSKIVEGGSGKLTAKLAWSSPLFSPAYDTLSGDVNLELAQGRLLEVNSDGAKLLDVLSLQSLFRFATLDLKGSLGNLATKGTPFNSISGNFEIAQGIAQTKKFTMILDQARVAMVGQINIPEETQDLRITIFPTIDATAGSLAAFAINPIVGLGAILGQYLITNQINRTMQTDYLVQGSWNNPEVIPLNQMGQPLDSKTMETIRTKNLLKEQEKPSLPAVPPKGPILNLLKPNQHLG